MIITDIFKKKGTRYQVELDGEYWTILDVEIIADFHLKKGMEISEELKDEVSTAADYRRGKEYALYLLGYRDHCRAELIKKLTKSIDISVAEEIADRMEELNLLDDARYAEKLAKYLITVKKRGPHRVLREMILKGIDREVAKEAIDSLEITDNPLEELIEKKYINCLSDEKDRNKTIAALLRRGYDYSAIVDAISKFAEE